MFFKPGRIFRSLKSFLNIHKWEEVLSDRANEEFKNLLDDNLHNYIVELELIKDNNDTNRDNFTNSEHNKRIYYKLSDHKELKEYNSIQDVISNGALVEDYFLECDEVFKYNYVTYHNLNQLGFVFEIPNDTLGISDVRFKFPELSPDVRDVIKNQLYTEGLVVVNGFVYPLITDNEDYLYIRGAKDMFSKNIKTTVGFLNYGTLLEGCALKRYSIDSDMISASYNEWPLFEGLDISLPFDFDPTVESLVLIVNGYTIYLYKDMLDYIAETNSIRFYPTKHNFVNKYIEAALYMDIPSLSMSLNQDDTSSNQGSPYNSNSYEYPLDDSIMSFITSNLSAIIRVPVPDLHIELYTYSYIPDNGKMLLPEKPVLPLVTNTTRIIDYMVDNKDTNKPISESHQDFYIYPTDDLINSIVFTDNPQSPMERPVYWLVNSHKTKL